MGTVIKVENFNIETDNVEMGILVTRGVCVEPFSRYAKVKTKELIFPNQGSGLMGVRLG
jgi:hypothetical protein